MLSRDPTITDKRKPKIKPPVGLKRAPMPPPEVKIGRPIAPKTMYRTTESVAHLNGRSNAVKKTKSVCSVIATGTIGILINVPALIRAVKRAVSIIIRGE